MDVAQEWSTLDEYSAPVVVCGHEAAATTWKFLQVDPWEDINGVLTRENAIIDDIYEEQKSFRQEPFFIFQFSFAINQQSTYRLPQIRPNSQKVDFFWICRVHIETPQSDQVLDFVYY